jgi:exopolysaccharide biosynthesis polyprenyl glycosylphosphotransferase
MGVMNAAHEVLAPAVHGPRLPEVGELDLAGLEGRRHRVHRRGWLVRRALLCADVAGLTLAFAFAQALLPGASDRLAGSLEALLFFGMAVPAWVIAAKVAGLYDGDEERASTTTTDDLSRVFQLSTLGAWLLVAVTWVSGLPRPDLGRVITVWLLAVATVTLARVAARAACRRRPSYLQNTVVVGAGDIGQLVARKFLQHPEYGINLLGFVDSEPRARTNGVAAVPVLGHPAQLPALVRALDVERVVVAFTRDPQEDLLDLVRSLNELDVQVDIVPRFFEVIGPHTVVHDVEGLSLVGVPSVRLPRSSRLLKRTMDLVVSVPALLLLAPVLAAIAIAIRLDSPGPALFTQLRMGSRDRAFRIVKFRTMVADAEGRKADVAHLNRHAAEGDGRMFKIPEDPRVTRVGRLLRRTSLDELPQLLNVVRGDMSLVGPRPLILDEHRHVRSWARRRLDLKPGITGLWQVLGRSDIAFDEMVRLDYVYVTSWSLGRDLRLILRTLPALVGRSRGAV